MKSPGLLDFFVAQLYGMTLLMIENTHHSPKPPPTEHFIAYLNMLGYEEFIAQPDGENKIVDISHIFKPNTKEPPRI